MNIEMLIDAMSIEEKFNLKLIVSKWLEVKEQVNTDIPLIGSYYEISSNKGIERYIECFPLGPAPYSYRVGTDNSKARVFLRDKDTISFTGYVPGRYQLTIKSGDNICHGIFVNVR